MDLSKLINTNVANYVAVPTPDQVHAAQPAPEAGLQTTYNARETIKNILDGKDNRLFIVVGPCSIHDIDAAMDYAERLNKLRSQISETLFPVMRVYFEKPRTTVGWKGLINDPDMDDSFNVEKGIRLARQLLIDITSMGLPMATEVLDPVMPQYISEMISWSAIGARTTESQTHREIASGLSMPVGFKNGTDGSIEVAINAMKSALSPHHFLGYESTGQIAKYETKGNAYSHVVLRGGADGPNYSREAIESCMAELEKNGLRNQIMIDCSHGNSNKDHNNQPKVFRDVIDQVVAGQSAICGMMVESHINEGNQKVGDNLNDLKYGVSITDACINWDTTEALLLEAHEKLKQR